MIPRNEKGQFVKTNYDKFHHGYKVIYKPDHPFSRSNGYVYEHVLVAEEKLGRSLRRGEVVHHIDENKLNNNPDNLMIFSSHAEHSQYHWDHRDHKLKTQDGRLLSYEDIAKESGVSYLTAYQRIKVLHWSVDEVLQGHRNGKRPYRYKRIAEEIRNNG